MLWVHNQCRTIYSIEDKQQKEGNPAAKLGGLNRVPSTENKDSAIYCMLAQVVRWVKKYFTPGLRRGPLKAPKQLTGSPKLRNLSMKINFFLCTIKTLLGVPSNE